MSKYETVYRVIENKDCNDFNNELEYTILTYDLDSKNNKIRVKGYNNWHEATNDYYYSRTLAEQALVAKCCNQLKQQLAERDKNKIQFAINQLEDIKNILYESHYKQIDDKYYAELEDLESVIDQRIKYLEGVLNGRK